MRRLVAGVLVIATLAFGVPTIGSANGTTANLVGQLVDVGGRGADAKRVELVRDGVVVSSAVTTAGGHFVFGSIAPGTYTVRSIANGQAAGLMVTVKAGETAPVLVVLPSMATASGQAQLASLLANLLATATGTIAAAALTEALEEAQKDEDAGVLDSAAENNAAIDILAAAIQRAVSAGTLTATDAVQLTNAVIEITNNIPRDDNGNVSGSLSF